MPPICRQRAFVSLHWPGMNVGIRNTSYTCQKCNERSSSESQEPIVRTPAPTYPFQKVCADYFETQRHSYLTYVDHFSGSISIFHFKSHQTTSQNLISEFRSLFENYRAPEEFSSDGGPQFSSEKFQSILEDCGVFQCTLSAGYPQSNGQASKRLIMDGSSKNVDLNNDKAARVILQYSNIVIPEMGLSPVQILFHRGLIDHIRTNLCCLRSGTIVEVLPFRQYKICLDRSRRIILRNQRHIKPYNSEIKPFIIPSATPLSEQIPNEPTSPNHNETAVAHSPTTPDSLGIHTTPIPHCIPRDLRNLADYNKPGLLGRNSPPA